MAYSRAIGRVLVSAVADHHLPQPDPVRHEAELMELPEAAAFHGVAGFVHRALRGQPLASLSDRLEATYHRAFLTHRQVLADLNRIAPALDSVGAPWLVIKGPVLAEATYPRPDLRGYADLDLVVPRDHFARFLDILEEGGAQVAPRDWSIICQQMPGEVQLRLPSGTEVDLHWHLVNQAELRQVFTLSMDDLLQRARPVELSVGRVATLDPVDTLIHLGLHGCLSGANRMVWLKDIEQTVARYDPSWEEVIMRSRASGTALTLATMLCMAKATIGMPVPDELIDELARSAAWRRVVTALGCMSPVERSTDHRSMMRLLGHTSRTGVQSSLAELSRRLPVNLQRLCRWPRPDLAEIPTTGGNRAAFLGAVAASYAVQPPG